jgi:[ribosomal protein S5]-alanine N-acetyltransferase
MDRHTYIETERLWLRNWLPSDTDTWVAMNGNPAVRRFFPNILDREASLASLDYIQQELMTWGYGLFATEVKETGAFIGFIGLSHPTFTAPFTPCVEIGWRLDVSAWGRGFATEGARACLEAGLGRWNLPEIYSFTSMHNTPSERVMQKIGMKNRGTFSHPSLPEGHWLREHVLYCAQNSVRRAMM